MPNIIRCRAQSEPCPTGDRAESRQRGGGQGNQARGQQGQAQASQVPGTGTQTLVRVDAGDNCPLTGGGAGQGGSGGNARAPASGGNEEARNATDCGQNNRNDNARGNAGAATKPPDVQPIGIETPKPLDELAAAEVGLALPAPLARLSLAELKFSEEQTDESPDTRRRAVSDVNQAYAGVRQAARQLLERHRGDAAAAIAGIAESFRAVDGQMREHHALLDDRLLQRHQGLVFELQAHREQALARIGGGYSGARMAIHRARNAGQQALRDKLRNTASRITEIVELAILPYRQILETAVRTTRTEIAGAENAMRGWRGGIDGHFPRNTETRMQEAVNEGKRETARCRVDSELPRLGCRGRQLAGTFERLLEPFQTHARQSLEPSMRAEERRARACGANAIDEARDRSIEAVARSRDAGRDWVKSQAAASERLLTQMLNAARSALRQQVEAKRRHLRQEAEQGRRRLGEAHDNQQVGVADSLKGYRDSIVGTAKQGQQAFRATGMDGAREARDTFAELGRRYRDGAQRIREGSGNGLFNGRDLFREESAAGVDRQQFAAWQALADAREKADDGVRQRVRGMYRLKEGVERTSAHWSKDYAERFQRLIDRTWDTIDQCEPVFQRRVDAKRAEVGGWVRQRNDPGKLFEKDLQEVERNVRNDVIRRADDLADELEDLHVSDETVVNAVRGLTPAQGRAVTEHYESSGGSLVEDIKSGTSGDDENAALAYLRGDAAAGAEYELQASIHWYNDDEARIRNTLRSLDDDQLRRFMRREGAQSTISYVRGNLGGVDRSVFNTLLRTDLEHSTRLARADTLDLQDKLQRARNRDEMNRELTNFYGNAAARGYGSHVTDADLRRLINDQMAVVRNVTDENGRVVTGAAADRVVRGVVQERMSELDRMRCGRSPCQYQGPYGEQLNRRRGAQADLSFALIEHGVGSPQERIARLGVEITRGGGRRMENIDQALVDQRLNPQPPELDPSRYPDGQVPRSVRESVARRRQQALAERAMILRRVAARYGDSRSAAAGNTGAQVADLLGRGQGRLGRQVIQGLVNDPFPSAETTSLILEYSAAGLGTNEALMKQATRRLNRAQIAAAADAYAARPPRGRSLWNLIASETSGQDFLDMEVAWMGRPRNARERAEVALFRVHQQRREVGFIGSALMSGSRTENILNANDERLRALVGGSVSFSRRGQPPGVTIRSGNFDEMGRFTGANEVDLDVAATAAQASADRYAKNIDEWASAVTTTIAIIGAVVATVVTGGGASPLLAAAIAGGIGASSMIANQVIRGGRYGWEEALTDLGMTGVQMLTAGLGQKLQAIAQASRTMGPIQQALLPAVVTGGLDSLGQTVLNDATWSNGFGNGIGEVFAGTLKGVLTASVAALGTQALQKIPVGRAAGAVDDLAGGTAGAARNPAWRTLGDVAGESTGALSRSAAQSLSSAGGAFLSRGTELGFDTALGRYHGDAGDIFTEMGKSAGQAALQGIGEGTGEAIRDRRRVAFGLYTRPGWMDPADYERLRAVRYGDSNAPAVPDIGSGTAAGIAGSRFRGDLHDSPQVSDSHVHRGIRDLTGDGGVLQGRVRPDPDGRGNRASIDLGDGGSVDVHFRVVNDMAPVDGEVPVARFDRRADGGYDVKVSSRADPELVQRALAHELTEIRVLQAPDARQRVADGDVLNPNNNHRLEGDRAPKLSPHDQGRIAEAEWLARRIAAEESRRPVNKERLRRLNEDMGDLLGHLGVVGETAGPRRRRELLMEHLSDARLRGALEEHAARSNDIQETRLTEIGQRRRAAAEGGLVDADYHNLPDAAPPAMRPGERMPGRSEVSRRVKDWLRGEARARFGRLMQEALLDPGKHTYLTQASMERLTQAQLDYIRVNGKLPSGVEFHHLLTVADFPEFAHLAEAGLALPKDVHREAGHAMDPTRPLDAATFLDPAAETRPIGLHNDPQAQKYNRAKDREIADGTRSRGDVDTDLVIDARTRLAQAERRVERLSKRRPTDRNTRDLNRARHEAGVLREQLAFVESRLGTARADADPGSAGDRRLGSRGDLSPELVRHLDALDNATQLDGPTVTDTAFLRHSLLAEAGFLAQRLQHGGLEPAQADAMRQRRQALREQVQRMTGVLERAAAQRAARESIPGNWEPLPLPRGHREPGHQIYRDPETGRLLILTTRGGQGVEPRARLKGLAERLAGADSAGVRALGAEIQRQLALPDGIDYRHVRQPFDEANGQPLAPEVSRLPLDQPAGATREHRSAAPVPHSRFHGEAHGGRGRVDLETATRQATGEVADLMARGEGIGAQIQNTGESGRFRLTAPDREAVPVRIEVVPAGDMPLHGALRANAEWSPEPPGFVVRVSADMDPSQVQRALAHELRELHEIAFGEQRRPHPGTGDNEHNLDLDSPHGRARLEEIAWLSRRIEQGDPDGRHTRELGALLRHLGADRADQGGRRVDILDTMRAMHLDTPRSLQTMTDALLPFISRRWIPAEVTRQVARLGDEGNVLLARMLRLQSNAAEPIDSVRLPTDRLSELVSERWALARAVGTLDLPEPVRTALYRTLGIEPPTALTAPAVRQPGNRDAVQRLVEQYGLQTRHVVQEGNANYSFTDPVDIGNGRVAVLAVVDDGSGPVLRLFYRSNSQAIFRLLPGHNKGLDHLDMPSYDKGGNEQALSVPTRVNEAISSVVERHRTRHDIPGGDPHPLLAAVPYTHGLDQFMDYARNSDNPRQQVAVQEFLTPSHLQDRLRLQGPDSGTTVHPRDIVVPPESMPDFSQAPYEYPTRSDLAGPLTAMGYSSADGSLQYTLLRDRRGRVWVGSVEYPNVRVTDLGVRRAAPKTGALTTPAQETQTQIAVGYQGAHIRDSYYENWQYVRQIPLIVEYYRQQGIPEDQIPD